MFRNAVELSHFYAAQAAGPGSVCIDATAGNGNDTAFLAGLVGPEGKVYAFDVQQKAIASTKKRLEDRGLRERVRLIHDSHARMGLYVRGPVDAILFNLGRLPGSDRTVYTKSCATIAAIEAGLGLLRRDGLLCIAAYWGDPICNEEYREVYDYLKGIPPRQAEVLVHEYINEPHCPPAFFAVRKV